jgi:hypothetical protein
MPRLKGLAKTGGRKLGTPNRTSEEVRQSLLKLLDDNLETLQKDIEGMKAKDRAYLLINLAKHCTAPALNPEKLTEEQLLQILNYLKDEQTKNKAGNN